jgi:plasmid stabilization system protein ParE
MAARVVLAVEVQQDIDESYTWYEQRRIGLGEEFLSSVDALVHATCHFPEVHPIVHESYRRGLVHRFPYAVFYEYANDTVTVYGVLHTSRDPAKWRERLR